MGDEATPFSSQVYPALGRSMMIGLSSEAELQKVHELIAAVSELYKAKQKRPTVTTSTHSREKGALK
jgi:hypothetical protein